MSKLYLFIIAILTALIIVFFTLPKPTDITLPQQTQQEVAAPISVSDLENGSYGIVPTNSAVWWTGRKPGRDHTGYFPVSEGVFTISNNEISEGSLTIDIANLVSDENGTSVDALVTHLKSADFFDVASYPTSTFTLSRFENGNITGELTIKNNTRSVSFPARITREGEFIHLNASFPVNRTDWGIRFLSGTFFGNLGDKAIQDMVDITIDVTFVKQ